MDWSLETVYLGCAALGGSVLVLQTLLMLIGGDVDADGDVDGDVGDHADGFGLLSVRAVASFLTFFGLAGWGGVEAGWGTVPTMAVATGAGLVMLFVVAGLMSQYKRIDSEGNINPKNAIGKVAKVYLRIPEAGSGQGKITVSIQDRSMEFLAITKGDAIPTGSDVRILSQTTPDTFEVEPLS